MDKVKIAEFIEEKRDFLFPNDNYSEDQLENVLLTVPDPFIMTINSIPFRQPSTVQLISIFIGSIGVDRFYLGDIKNGIIKYFTFGGLGIWWIKDIITSKNRCRAYNCKKIMDVVNDPSVVSQMQNVDNNINGAYETAKAFAPVAKSLVKGLGNIRDTFNYK